MCFKVDVQIGGGFFAEQNSFDKVVRPCESLPATRVLSAAWRICLRGYDEPNRERSKGDCRLEIMFKSAFNIGRGRKCRDVHAKNRLRKSLTKR